MELLDALNWRYATKRMNGEKVAADKLNVILESIRLSASSLGLQPYRIIVVDDPALKAKIHESACPQPQILECSHLLVFASYKNVTNHDADKYLNQVSEERNLPKEQLAQYDGMIKGFLASRTPEQLAEWSARQAYIALGTGLVAAAIEQVDATPMEGFTPSELDKVLGLEQTSLNSVVLLALGYRDSTNDYLASAKKVRVSSNELFSTNR